MQNLLYFLYRYGYVLLFVLLEFICLTLVVRYNPDQRTIFLRSSGAVSGWVLNNYESVVQFFQLSRVAKDLASQNARLKEQQHNLRIPFVYQSDSILDTVYRQQFELYTCKIINNAHTGLDNYFTIDQGSDADIRRGMGVIGDEGVVGIITDVNGRYARGISILNRSTRISAAIERNGFFGNLYWEGGNPRAAKVGHIPKHADIRIGDMIVTSGYSAIFPAGLPIGTVTDFQLAEGSNYYEIDIQLINDLSNIAYVYVVKNLFKEDQLLIETDSTDGANSQ